ncbi:hypothetical protein BAUCODRAFT_144864 [Baudoinia panamericana UAMH 10762]|uniref:Uncharacterized protein n=1 Tax=Baudoinia panamericana (strain UAMH 10762) TaxID=717646 RepID=M2LXL7_BAUPA|nr:uncharacterized protein BAUCODRAFT_144864 [Baudoinia panamericana UAMH 10762]EMC99437.1 hypothetical protein BAUCODRAFT_144864 [Baudoinia panamericana UAMH 10762]
MLHTYNYAALATFLTWVVWRWYTNPLRKFPGPSITVWTDAWRFLDAVTGAHRATTQIELHKQYGDVVRLGPTNLSFSHPDAIRDIYGVDKPFPKSGYYWAAAAVQKGVPSPSLFSSLDATWHDNLRRAVNPAFTLSALRQYEPFVNNTIASLFSQLNTRFADKPGKDGIVDLARWMHWYAFDVVGEITYGAPIGFLETASDVDGIIAKAHWYLCYAHCVGQWPWLDGWLLKNPVLLWFNRQGYFNARPNPVVAFAGKRQEGRANGDRGSHDDDQVDLIDKFLQAKESHPETVSDRMVLGMGISMVLAGSESTGVTLTALLYYVLKSPPIYQKLQAEIDTAFPDHEPGTAVSLAEAQKLPYLDACIKEAFRAHPAARFGGERVVPPTGAVIAGHKIPGGTTVAVNAWNMHRRTDVYGEDVETYRPERWLERDEAQVAEMNRLLTQFGHGRFSCIGKNISLLEMYKVVPSLLRSFRWTLAEPERQWRFESGSFANVSGVGVRVERR